MSNASLILDNGSADQPSIIFAAHPKSGFYLDSNEAIGFSVGGSNVLSVSASLSAVKVQKFSVAFASLNTAGTGVAALFGVAIPVGAIVVRSFINVGTSFTGNGDSGSTIKIGLQDQAATGDVHASGALSVYAAGLVEGVSTGTAATMKPVSTTAKRLAVIWTIGGTDTALSAGAADVYIEYVGA